MRFLSIFLFLLGIGYGYGVNVPTTITHHSWDALLKTYVDEDGLVDYKAWKAKPSDRMALDAYLQSFADKGPFSTNASYKVAALVNYYNAATIAWILDNYPVESIRKTDNPWKKDRWTVGGEQVSLDAIEHEYLRDAFGYRVHAIIVCAARSCPPLQREAFTKANLDALADQAFREWLRRDDLNRFAPDENRVYLSKIFKWFSEDFKGDGGLLDKIRKYAPAQYSEFLQSDNLKIDYLDYHWGLNDQSDLGKDYDHSIWSSLF